MKCPDCGHLREAFRGEDGRCRWRMYCVVLGQRTIGDLEGLACDHVCPPEPLSYVDYLDTERLLRETAWRLG